MTTGDWTLSTWADAGQLAASVNRAGVPAAARGMAPARWCETLRQQGESAQAATFMAHAMPRYECVMWAVRALIDLGVDRADPALVAALRWIDNPSDALRRAAAAAGEVADDDSPQALLCQAIFLSGGSISGEDLPPIQPPPDVCAKLASAAVLVRAYALDDPQAALARALATGDSILRGAS